MMDESKRYTARREPGQVEAGSGVSPNEEPEQKAEPSVSLPSPHDTGAGHCQMPFRADCIAIK